MAATPDRANADLYRRLAVDALRPPQIARDSTVAAYVVETSSSYGHSVKDVHCSYILICCFWFCSLWRERFHVESKGRRKKLNEVGYVTTICFGCFFIRCIMVIWDSMPK